MTKFFIDQHGCAKNQVDGELLISHLVEGKFQQVFNPADADLIIINSCGFIESAKKESLDAVYAARKNYPNAKIILAGCLAERYAEAFEEALPEADGFFGNGDLSKITDAAKKIMKGKRIAVKPAQTGVSCGSRNTLLSFKGSAYVKITEGCSNHCSFCAIPLIRGELRSRAAADIIAEIKTLLEKGVFEINLIGQDLAAYGTGAGDDVFGTGRFALPEIAADRTIVPTKKKSALFLLLKEISSLKGKFWIRLLYIHPDHFNRDILDVLKKDERILPYFDIPFQSGSDSIIKAMNRKCSAAEYIRLASDIRSAFPQAALRTTFLTGFPGETEKDAADSVALLKGIQSDWSGSFCYSREEDTASYNLKGRVSKKEASSRAALLVETQKQITQSRLQSRVGKTYDVLIEELVGEQGTGGNAPDGECYAIARAWFQAPEVDGACVVRYDSDDKKAIDAIKPGCVVKAKAVAASDVDLDCIFISDSGVKISDSEKIKFIPNLLQEDNGQA